MHLAGPTTQGGVSNPIFRKINVLGAQPLPLNSLRSGSNAETVREKNVSILTMYHASNPFTMEDLIRHRMMIQTPQAEEDLVGYIPRSHFAHPSVASNGLGGSRMVVQLPNGRRFVVNGPSDTSAASTTGPGIAQLPDGRWVRANNSTQPTQTSTRGRRTVQLSDGRHVIINESSPCQASQATTEGPRIVRLPNGRRIVIDDSSSDDAGGSGFDRFTQSTQPQPTFMHSGIHQPVNSFHKLVGQEPWIQIDRRFLRHLTIHAHGTAGGGSTHRFRLPDFIC